MSSNTTTVDSKDTGEYNDGGISAILTLNLMIFGAVIIIFSIMRRRKENEQVYFPRALKGTDAAKTLCGAEPVPQPVGLLGWITAPQKVTEMDILYRYGLDTTMYLRFQQMVGKLFVLAAVLSACILVPVNMSGDNNEKLSKADDDKKWTRGFNDWVVTNLPDKTDKLWAHYVVFLIITIATYMVAFAFGHAFYVLRKKHQVLLRRKQTAASHTVMIRNLPPTLRDEEPVRAALDKQYPGHVLKVWLTFHQAKLEKLRKKQVELRRKIEVIVGTLRKNGVPPEGTALERLSKLDLDVPPVTQRILDTIKEEDDTDKKKEKRAKGNDKTHTKLDKALEKLEEVHEKIDEEMAVPIEDQKTTCTAFAMFDTVATAQMCAQNYYFTFGNTELGVEDMKDTTWEVTIAPAPEDIIWSNLVHRPPQLLVRSLLFNAGTMWLVIFWAIPVGILGSLEGLASLPAGIGNAFAWLQDLPGFVVGFLGAYLPMGVAIAFNALLPTILSAIAVQEGTLTHSERKTKVLKKFYMFTLFSVIILPSVFIGSLSKLGEIVNEIANDPLNQILALITEITSPKTGLFCALLIQTALGASSLAILRLPALILPRIMRKIAVTARQKVDALKYPEFEYHIAYARLGLMFAITMLFSITMPITVPFGAMLFLAQYVSDRYNLLYVHPNPKQNVDTNPPAMMKLVMITCLVLQIAVTGMFIGKKAPIQAGLSGVNIVLCIIMNSKVDKFWIQLFRADVRIDTPIDDKYFSLVPMSGAATTADEDADAEGEEDALLQKKNPLKSPFGVFNQGVPQEELLVPDDDEAAFNPEDHMDDYVHPALRDLDEPPPDDPDDDPSELQEASKDLEEGNTSKAAAGSDTNADDEDKGADSTSNDKTDSRAGEESTARPLPEFVDEDGDKGETTGTGNGETDGERDGDAPQAIPPLSMDQETDKS